MHQAPLPPEYAALTEEEAAARIRVARAALGTRLVILGHHYQRDAIIEHADFRGDSYKLAKDAARQQEAEFIVFCGVHFMAESADILTPDKQIVILPNLAAGCSMADMASIFQVRNAWKQLKEVMMPQPAGTLSLRGGTAVMPRATPFKIVPVTYINSTAALKGFVGENGGTVCTSTNAPQAVRWALEQGDKVLFFPDQHLGRNTGVKLGFDPDKDMCVWDPFKPLGGNTAEKLRASTFLLWKGHCSVHARFTLEQLDKARREFPDINVLVHPECSLDVVQASDLNGSTEYIIKTVSEAASGTSWAVGTEINLVSRLAHEFPDKTIFCLDPQVCPCSTMYRIHPSFLLWALESLVRGEVVNQITVSEPTKSNARRALDQMLRIGG